MSRIAIQVLSVLLLGTCLSSRAGAQVTIEDIIDNVRANEKLYENIEMVVRRSYERHLPDFPGGRAVQSYEVKARIVLQDELIYLKHDQQIRDVEGKSVSQDCLHGYDGEVTRMVEQNSYANIHSGKVRDPRALEPHLFLLNRWSLRGRLSDYLAGEQSQFEPGFQWECTFEGEETLNGLRCFKLRLDTLTTADPARTVQRSLFWLAPERNYLLVKSEFYRPDLSETLVGEIGETDDLREIAPGLWFPFHFKTVSYHAEVLAQNKHIVDNTEEGFVDEVKLNPHYDIDLFRNIPIPPDIPVYVLADGEVVDQYWQEYDPGTPAPRSTLFWLLMSNLLILVIGVCYWYFRYRFRQHANT